MLAHRQPAGRHAENRPDPDGIWRSPAPSLMPCCACGAVSVAILPSPVCPACAAWQNILLRIRARGAAA